MVMRKYLHWIFIIILIASIGCTKIIVPQNQATKKAHAFDTATFNYIYSEALKQKLMGNSGDALKYLEQCIQLDPRSDASYFQIAQISVQHNDFENGRIYAEKAVRLDGNNLWYLSMLANIYYNQKNNDSALVYFQKAIREYPEKDFLKVTEAAIYSEKSEFNKAGEIYEELEKKYGIGGKLGLLTIKNLINAKKYNEAEDKVLKVIKDNTDDILYNGMLAEIYKKKGENDKAMTTYKKLIDIDSTNTQTIISLSGFLIEEKEYDDLFKMLNGIVINDKFSRNDIISIFSGLIENGDLIRDRSDELEVILRVLESTYDNDNIIFMFRPDLYVKESKMELAASRLEEIILIQPDNYMAWEKLLVIYSDLKNYDRLYTLGKECSSRFNMSYIAKMLYASAAMEKKEYSIALEELNKAKILAGNQDELVTQVLSMEADVLYRKKEFSKSFEIYRSILRTNPEDVIVLNNYAYFLAEQNQDLKEAERMIRIVINREKGNGTFIDTFAWVLYKRGRYKEAAKAMEELMIKDKSEDSEWFEHYGYIMKALKKCDIAVYYWTKALKLDNDKEYLKQEIEGCTK